MMPFTSAVGYKFNEDGSLREFLGATIISPIEKSELIYKEIEKIAREARGASLAHKYSFLPPSSYHMTNFVLYNDNEKDRNSTNWSSKFPKDTLFHQMNAMIYEHIKDIPVPKSYTMSVLRVDDNSLKLVSANDATEQKIRSYRNAIAEATGIYWDDHKEYIFHLSYAYCLITLSKEEEETRNILLKKQTERIQKILPEFEIGAPVFCTLRDMGHFSPYITNN